MPLSVSDLSAPIDWTDPRFHPMLSDLQGHILKHHGRDNANHLFLQFGGTELQTRMALARIGRHVLSALDQLRQVAAHKSPLSHDGGTALFLYLSATGYAKIGVQPPGDPAFLAGMRNRNDLSDPPVEFWEQHHRAQVDALLIIADVSDTKATAVEGNFMPILSAGGIVILGRDIGRALKDAGGVGHEHFGYVDGISQPLLLADDVAREAAQMGTDWWDPAFGPLVTALVRDLASASPDSFGSYLIYRKLEQNVLGFKKAERALATAMGIAGTDARRERAGAMVVGRFENGTPVALSGIDAPANATNNFSYALPTGGSDADGLKCPFHAHIRKANPRGDTGDGADERNRLMPRRGIPFGERADDWTNDNDDTKPDGGVGLLFMAFNHDIGRQFEFTQTAWVDNPDFIFGRNRPGLDPLIGQREREPQKWRPTWNDSASQPVDFEFGQFVNLRGGEYYYAPPISFLVGLSSP